MNPEALAKFKAVQKEGWALFAPVEVITTAPAAKLVAFAGVKKGERVLDVGCGTGVAAITAARIGAEVVGVDLTPELIEKARWNAEMSRLKIDFQEGDVEQLAFPDAAFDVVLSQFGHMFAPRPLVAIQEMLRVLKPGGRIAFSTWPPELYTGRMFAMVAKYLPPPPPDVGSPPQWGDVQMVRERLGDAVENIRFERELMISPCLSIPLFRHFMETVGPLAKAQQFFKDAPEKQRQFRAELEALISEFVEGNTVRQHFLMTRAEKR